MAGGNYRTASTGEVIQCSHASCFQPSQQIHNAMPVPCMPLHQVEHQQRPRFSRWQRLTIMEHLVTCVCPRCTDGSTDVGSGFKALCCRHWELILRNVEVSSAEVLVPGESAKLQATVQESAKLIDRDGAVEEAFDHPVIVEYGLSWHEDEGWRIAAFQEMNSASCT